MVTTIRSRDTKESKPAKLGPGSPELRHRGGGHPQRPVGPRSEIERCMLGEAPAGMGLKRWDGESVNLFCHEKGPASWRGTGPS